MRGMALAALASLVGLVVCVALYLLDPLPMNGFAWQDPSAWIPVLLLVMGLSCFILLLVSGLVTILNWTSDRPSESRPNR